MVWCCVLGILVSSGCDGDDSKNAADADAFQSYAAQKQTIWSGAALSGEVMTPTDIKEAVGPLPETLLIKGRINAGDFEAFGDSEATFVLSQLPDSSHAGGDANHADNCPFCKRKLKNAPKAIVRITDDQDQVLPISVDQWLGLKKNDVVTVSGTAVYNEPLNTVMVRAEKISREK